MAKRRSRQKTRNETFFVKRRALLLKIGWIFIVAISVLFGVSYAYPLFVEGQTTRGIITGLAYGGGALAVILISVFLNRKLKGL